MIVDSQERAEGVATGDMRKGLVRPSHRPRWSLVIDAAVVGALAAFVWWTVLYEVTLAAGWPTTPVTVCWLVTAPVVVVAIAKWNLAHARGGEDEGPRLSPQPGGPQWRGNLPALALLVAIVVSAGLMATATHIIFRVGWGLGILCLLAVGYAVRLRAVESSGSGDSRAALMSAAAPSTTRTRDDLIALVVSCAVTVGSLFVIRPIDDDAYYVNISTWIAEHGHIPVRDTMYGNQTFPSTYGGGFPITSIEAQIGALARIFHLLAGTMAYLVIAPLCTFASIWVLWQLAHLWSRRRPLPAFLFSIVFVLAGTGGTYRSYSTSRIWEGKAIAVSIVIPLIWIFATRLARTRDRHWTVLLGLAGIAFAGLTTTAALLGLTLACAIALAAVVLANRDLLWGAVALAVPALASGAAVAVLSGNVGGLTPTAPAAWAAVRYAYGAHPTMMIVTIVSVLAGPLLVRGTSAATLIWSSAVASLAVLTPGVLTFLNSVTGSGPVEWRLLLSPPAPTLIGLCAAAGVGVAVAALASGPVPARIASMATALVVVCAFAVVGTPPWASSSWIAHRPSWKVSPHALQNVRAFVAADPSTAGTILMPTGEMRVLAIYTTRWYAVVPRAFDLPGLVEPAKSTAARRTLLKLVSTTQPNPSAARVKSALKTLNVTTVCLWPSDVTARKRVRAAGYPAFQTIGSMTCSLRIPAKR